VYSINQLWTEIAIRVNATGPNDMTDIFNIAGRVAIVTGASQGLGRQFAISLAAHGDLTGLF
jgi:hypothetical protein